jgi:hypothetical protein
MTYHRFVSIALALCAVSIAGCGDDQNAVTTSTTAPRSSTTDDDGGGPGGGPGGAVDPAAISTEAELVDMIGGPAVCGEGSLDLHRGHREIEAKLEGLLGISHDEMHEYMENQDMNLAAVADEVGLGAEDLEAALVEYFAPAIDNLVSAGTITADAAGGYRNQLTTTIEFRVNWDGQQTPPASCAARS